MDLSKIAAFHTMINVLKTCLMFIITAIDLLIADNDSASSYQSTINHKIHGLRQLRSKPHHYSKNMSPIGHQLHSFSQDTLRNRRPNIILILTDDQDVELGSLNFMSETSRLLKNSGAEFRHAYTTTPMCCPSRSSMLTGVYVHNHNVYTNNDNCSNIQWQTEHETKSFASYLSNAGYYTGYFGKYLNKYNGSYTPPGWKEWGGLIMNSKYYNYSINLNGKRIRHGDDYHKDYYPDLIANDSVNFLRQWKTWNSHKPTLLVMSFPAPHGPEDSAPQYSNMFFNVTTHHTPSYDYAPNPDKQWILQVTGPMMPIHKQFTDKLMTKRLQTLQSVDNAVKKIYDVLKEIGELSNSYIIYTSDHGYHLGQFGLIKGKSFPFEFDIRVPFLVRGPGIEPGSIINEIALNIDLAPTILDIAGLPVPPHMDGRSLMKLLHRRKKNNRKYPIWPDTFLVESSGRREFGTTQSGSILGENASGLSNISKTKIKNKKDTVINYSTDWTTESVDTSDELNVLKLPNSNGLDSDNVLVSGDNENMSNIVTMNVPLTNKAERLSLECKKPEFASPCAAGQKWHCVLHDNRWRKHKCRFRAKQVEVLPNIEKCTCINENGIVYLKFQTANEKRIVSNWNKPKETHRAPVNYLKSNKSSDDLVDELAELWRIMKRYRRDTVESKTETLNSQISNIMEVIDGQMIELLAFQNNMNNTACIISDEGSVRCSQEIYDNPKLWEISQRSIIERIKTLQNQLGKLKKVQRHLYKNQPNNLNTEKFSNSANKNIFSDNGGFIQNPLIFTNISNNIVNNSDVFRINTSEFFTANHKHRHRHNVSKSSIRLPKFSDSKFRNESKLTEINKSIPDACYCVPYVSKESVNENFIYKEQKRRIKEQRMKKNERKLKRRAKSEKECYVEKMNCFNHDNDHWRTPPYWTDGPFCFCVNANNNTYSCLRTINATHNFLYCEFVTGFITFYNLRIDPFQQWNRYNLLSTEEKSWLKATLLEMVHCKGMQKCSFNGGIKIVPSLEEYQNSKINILSDRKHRRKNMTRYQNSRKS